MAHPPNCHPPRPFGIARSLQQLSCAGPRRILSISLERSVRSHRRRQDNKHSFMVTSRSRHWLCPPIDMGRSLGEHNETAPRLIGVAKGVAIGVVAIALTLDASVQELAELVSMSDDARRERFHLSPACTPIVSAMKGAEPNSSRLTVFIDCGTRTTGP